MVDYLMVYNFKISWVGAYRGTGSYNNEYSTHTINQFLPDAICPRNLKGGIGSLFDPCINAMERRPY